MKQKIKENYTKYTQNSKYTQNKNRSTNYETKENYKNKTLTKWQYLKEWLKYSNMSYFRKVIGLFGVLLESLLCLLIKYLLILFAFLSNTCSYFIRYLYSLLSPILGIIAVLFVSTIIINGLEYTFKENKNYFIATLIIIVIYTSSYILPLISNLLLSEKIFNLLYNKIDINLFKICVGYKD